MKTKYLLILLLAVAACTGKNQQQNDKDSTDVGDTASIPFPPADTISAPADTTGEDTPTKQPPAGKVYSNQRFKDVTVQRTGDHTFLIKGRAQVFEAAFSWVVEDGHNELKEGHEMTDAGAPAFGNFSFTVDVVKQRKNSTLTLILYEASAKDGSRQHQLPIPLY